MVFVIFGWGTKSVLDIGNFNKFNTDKALYICGTILRVQGIV